MSRSPAYQQPSGTEGKSLAGIKPCGCITAAHAIHEGDTQKDIADFYASMAKTGRTIEWRSDDEIRSTIFQPCPHERIAA